MNLNELNSIAVKLVADHRGILAADESTSTIEKRFKSIGVENTEEHRRAYRDMLFSTPGAAKFISGVIMYDETIRQKTKAGVSFAEVQAQQSQIAANQAQIDSKLATLAEAIRVARIYASRSGGH